MPIDLFRLLDDQTLPDPAHATAPPVLTLWREGKYYLMFFTSQGEQLASHYDEAERSYLCLGEGCPACGAGVRSTKHVYLPVWDAQNRRVAVLKFDARSDGPAARILAFLRRYKDRLADVVAVIVCRGRG